MGVESLQFDLIVHATHEAGIKLGGIGAVLEGLLGTQTYNLHIARTILIGPMDTDDTEQMDRLTAPRNHLEIRYSSEHGIHRIHSALTDRLRSIEQQHGVKLLYGARAFGDAQHEVILIDAQHAHTVRVDAFKASLYGHFGIQSDRYENQPEYSLYINSAEAQYQALRAVSGETRGIIIAHEFMGMPLCYSAMMHARDQYRTVFYGHEVATVRPIIESHPGHDTMFYTTLIQARQSGLYLENVFGDQSHLFKHALIRPVPTHCDNIFAVGDWVIQEMRFLGSDWDTANIETVYNGVPTTKITLERKAVSGARLQRYCANLLGYTPDYVFTHVTRFVPSKGLWRDIRVMEQAAPLLAQRGETAVLFVLSSIIPVGRSPQAIFEMETRYGWPVRHRTSPVNVDGSSVPDLVGHEIPFYYAIEQFNRDTSAAKIVLVNQFGWSRDRCGDRMPADMTFADIRHGSDLEFGQSVYEPFGIAQLEPLCTGALCVVSSICGCLGFLERVGGLNRPNVIVADYTDAGPDVDNIEAALSIDQPRRDRIENIQARAVARQIVDRLPLDESAARAFLEQGRRISQRMSWEVVARDYLLPGLERARKH